MKRGYKGIVVSLLLAAVTPLLGADYYKTTVNGIDWVYTIENGTASLGYLGSDPDILMYYGSLAVSRDTIGDVVIPSRINGYSVTDIKAFAFQGCSGITSITIPSSVRTMGISVFEKCEGLRSVTINAQLKTLNSWTFEKCGRLSEVSLPSTLRQINQCAFAYCSNLTAVAVPVAVTNIGAMAFDYCMKLKTVNIPSGVTSIENNLFRGCQQLESIELPDGVTRICNGAFEGCTNLANIAIPPSVISVGDSAFQNCPRLVANGLFVSQGVVYLASKDIVSATIPDGVVRIADSAFGGCKQLREISIPESVTNISVTAFTGCSNLKDITIPSCVRSIPLTFPDSFPSRIVFQDGVTNVADYICEYCYCDNLTNVVLPSSMIGIGRSAFYSCTNLTYINIPSSLKYIESHAFHGCKSLKNLDLSDIGNINDGCFYGCESLTNIVIPASVRDIGQAAFQGCSSLTNMVIPASVRSIGRAAFQGCSSLTDMTIPSGVDTRASSIFRDCTSLTNVTFGSSVYVESFMFAGCTRLEKISMPNGIKSIAEAAFSNCTSLVEISLSSNARYIPANVFWGCSRLVSIEIPSSVTDIGRGAFCGCSSLTSVTIPSSVTRIGNGAFSGCASLSAIAIPPNVLTIGTEVFADCGNLTDLTMSSSVTNISATAFLGCTNLRNVSVPPVVKALNMTFPSSYQVITNVTLLSGRTNVDRQLFDGCDSLKQVSIPASVSAIVRDAFGVCPLLEYIDVSGENQTYASVNGILYAREGKSLLHIPYTITSFIVPEGIESIGDYASANRSNLVAVSFGSAVTNLGEYAFSGCSNLSNITIPSSVLQIGNGAFYGCSSLYEITIPESVSDIGSFAFSACRSLKYVTLSTGVRTIGGDAFSGCAFKQVIVPSTAQHVGEGAFRSCKYLTTMALPFANLYYDRDRPCGIGYFFGISELLFFASETDLETLRLVEDLKTSEGNYYGTTVGSSAYDIKWGNTIHRAWSVYCSHIPQSLRNVYFTSGIIPDISAEWRQNCDLIKTIANITLVVDMVNVPYMRFTAVGGDAMWGGEQIEQTYLLHSGNIRNSEKTLLESTTDGPGMLQFQWKVSSEHDKYGNCYDFAELAVDGQCVSRIGGEIGWTNIIVSIEGEGRHTIRWTYLKDEIDEGECGEDRTWIKDIVFTPLTTVSFNIGTAIGTPPANSSGLARTKIKLPTANGFTQDGYVLDGWSDGEHLYMPDSFYTIPYSNVCLIAQWTPLVNVSFDIGDGVGCPPDVIIGTIGETVTLPALAGFEAQPFHRFGGWSDGTMTFMPGEVYVLPETNQVMYAVWLKNQLCAPVISSEQVSDGAVLTGQSATIEITAEIGATIRYTLDGTVPTHESPIYTAPFTVSDRQVVIKAIACMLANYHDSPVATFSFVRGGNDLSECLNPNADYVIETGGDVNWARDMTISHDGVDSLRSGTIAHGQSSWLCMTVCGTGTLDFWWKVSSQMVRQQKYDYVSCVVDGVEIAWYGGIGDWTNIVYSINSSGTHVIEWIYLKDESGSAGCDCAWLDDVIWVGNGYRVDLNANGGDGGDASVSVTYGQPMPTIITPTKKGYTFGGYWVSPVDNIGQYYNTDGTGTRDWDQMSDKMLWAHWNANSYVIRYDSNGGDGTMPNMECIYDIAANISSNLFRRTGYVFAGWATNTVEKALYMDGQSVMNLCSVQNGIATLYAVWEKIDVPISYGEPIVFSDISAFTCTPEADSWISCGDGIFSPRAWSLFETEPTGEDKLKSLTLAVSGAGKLSFKWSIGDYAKLSISTNMDGMVALTLRANDVSAGDRWDSTSLEFESQEAHLITWTYTGWYDFADAAIIKDIVWTPSVTAADVPVDMGGGKSVTVPQTWIEEHPAIVSAAGGNVSAALASKAANRRMSVAECYVVGVDPEKVDEDFKVTFFPMKADGTPDLENIVFDPPEARWRVPGARAVVKGAAELGGEWQAVTEENKAGFRFFKVEVELP